MKNPVVLWAHDYQTLPVGRSVSVVQSEGTLLADVECAEHSFADTNVQAAAYLAKATQGDEVALDDIAPTKNIRHRHSYPTPEERKRHRPEQQLLDCPSTGTCKHSYYQPRDTPQILLLTHLGSVSLIVAEAPHIFILSPRSSIVFSPFVSGWPLLHIPQKRRDSR